MLIKITGTASLRVMRYVDDDGWRWALEESEDVVGATGGPYTSEDEAVVEGLRACSWRSSTVGRAALTLLSAELADLGWEL